MLLVNNETGDVVSLAQLAEQHPTVSFPANWTDATCEKFCVSTVIPSAPPEYDPEIQTLEQGHAEKVGGFWQQRWKVVEKVTEAEKAEIFARRERDKETVRIIDVKRQIADVEAGQGRAIREAIINGDASYLKTIEEKISALRATL